MTAAPPGSGSGVEGAYGPVGCIGLGNMGGRMAARLLRAGHTAVGHDPHTSGPEGAERVSSPAEVARRCRTILLSLPSSRTVEEVMHGADGLIDAVRPETVVVDLSTSEPASTIALSPKLADKGAELVDAGVSGGAAAAEAGELTLMVGGPEATVDRLAPVFSAFATNVFRLGSVGAGHTAKLLNNFLNAIALSATAEVMVAGRKAGLDLTVLLDAINVSSGVNFATQKRFPKIIEGDYLKGGLTNALMMKDVLAYVDLVAGLGVASPNSAAAVSSFGTALQLGYADVISNTVVDAIGDLSGGVRVHDKDHDTGRNGK
ncbi:NAD(P)-dependent oxidoreductase [Streptomyces sp. HNM0575]|uniref:NAD(P)-dependent oxidoreductase n=1 Tax=Streptomyces sp. HNM0575 TaxID=2716338 RepID=UPI00145CD2F7|nr:NAD(P)-dependent oxidoreductase [Streptomyces sp. HNM0575]NLU71879.1 NAD(P)-dependent oxidoreductase [Streptomyces sp. HNM0575]